MGFVVEDFALECGCVERGDVGRVRSDDVERVFVGWEEIALEEADAVGEAEAESVVAGDFEGVEGDVSGEDFGGGLVGRERESDGAGAGADVEQAERFELGLRPCEDGFDEVLGFGARDEHGRSDTEGEAVELLYAGEVLEGFACGSALREGEQCCGLLRSELGFRVREEPGAGLAEYVREKKLGVAAGDLCGGFEKDVVDGHALVFQHRANRAMKTSRSQPK